MSFVVTAPDLLSAAAGRLQVIGSTISAANATAAFPITGVIPAAADEVSAATAAAFSGYGQVYQAISAEAALIHEEFVRALGLGAHSYAATEVANATQAAGGQVPAVPARMAPTAPARPAMPARMAPTAPGAPARPAAPRTPAAPARPAPTQHAPAAPASPAGPATLPAMPAQPAVAGYPTTVQHEHYVPAYPAPAMPEIRTAAIPVRA